VGMPTLPESALRAAYDAHGGELYRFARRSLGDAGLAEEAVQEAFVRAWRASASYDPARASQRTWLFAILRNVVIDLVRARRVRPPLAGADPVDAAADGAIPGSGASSDDAIDRMLTVWQVEAALARLAEDHRRVLVEVHWRGRPYADVASELGVPEGTVKSRVYYGLRAMRDALESEGWRDG
jgi:RNA polymerase sigma-70 factor, ECF subfamily